jgi:RimJ/RimL family protein N-acetyltransferase
MTAPEIETARLHLRAATLADLEDVAALWADPEVVRFIGGQVSTREQSWARLLRYVGHWELLGYGFWAVIDRETGRYVGEVGIGRFERDIVPPLGDFEAGWVLAPWAHGRGLATEAMQAVLAWTDAKFPSETTAALVDLPNVGSHRVATKLGYRELGHREYHGATCIAYARSPG